MIAQPPPKRGAATPYHYDFKGILENHFFCSSKKLLIKYKIITNIIDKGFICVYSRLALFLKGYICKQTLKKANV